MNDIFILSPSFQEKLALSPATLFSGSRAFKDPVCAGSLLALARMLDMIRKTVPLLPVKCLLDYHATEIDGLSLMSFSLPAPAFELTAFPHERKTRVVDNYYAACAKLASAMALANNLLPSESVARSALLFMKYDPTPFVNEHARAQEALAPIARPVTIAVSSLRISAMGMGTFLETQFREMRNLSEISCDIVFGCKEENMEKIARRICGLVMPKYFRG